MPGIQIWHHFCDLSKFWSDDLLTYILTLWIKSKNADDHQISQPYLLPIIYQNMEHMKFSVFE